MSDCSIWFNTVSFPGRSEAQNVTLQGARGWNQMCDLCLGMISKSRQIVLPFLGDQQGVNRTTWEDRKAVPISVPDMDTYLTCLWFYATTVLVPTYLLFAEACCFDKFLSPISVPDADMNPAAYSVYSDTWNQKIVGWHVTITCVFFQDSKISKSFWGR
jgi:hypothetical protein